MTRFIFDAFSGRTKLSPVFWAGYWIPTCLGVTVAIMGKPIAWGWAGWPTVVFGMLTLHQVLMVTPLWRCSRNDFREFFVLSGRVSSGLAVCFALLLGSITVVSWRFNLNDGGVAVGKDGEQLFDVNLKARTTIADLKLGSFVCGPNLRSTDLRDKAVVVEYWGVTCGPCLAGMPHLGELTRRHDSTKLVVIAKQNCSASDDRVLDVFKKRMPDDSSVCVINGGEITGFKVRGVPHVFVFSPDGRLLWNGNPRVETFDGMVERAVAMPISQK